MNLNKYTKAELISKMNELKSKKGSNSTLFTKTLGTLLILKNVLLKITLIAIIIKVFKKYSILRKIWTIFNTILVSIFGISIIDIYEIELLSNLSHGILNILTKFKLNILELFDKKVEAPIKNPSTMRSVNPNSNGNQESSKIIERFNKIIHNEPEEMKEDTPIYKNKYVIIGGILVLSCLTWYFYEDIKPIGSSIISWINTLRSRPNPDPDDTNGNLQGDNKSYIRSIKDSLTEKFYGKAEDSQPPTPDSFMSLLKKNKDTILDKGKKVDLTNISETELTRRATLEKQDSGLIQITGFDFPAEASAIISEISTFIKYQNESSFPKTAIQIGLYNLIRERLLKLSEIDEKGYTNLLEDSSANNLIENFLSLEKELFNDQIPSPAYEEVALTTIQERDVWSDKANTPSVKSQLLSPIAQDKSNNLELTQLNNPILGEAIKEDDQSTGFHTFTIPDVDKDLEEAIKEVFKQETKTKAEIKSNPPLETPQPDIVVDHASDSSMDHFFSKTELPLDESSKIVTSSPNIANVGLQTPIQERFNNSPLLHKPSLSNMFEDTKNLFEDNPIDTEIDTSGEDSVREEVPSNNENRSSFLGVFKDIISRGKDLKSPELVDKKDLPDGAESQQETEDVNNQQDVIDCWEAVSVKIENGNVHERFATIDFKGRTSEASKILILTNDGRSRYFDPHFSNDSIQTFKWDTLGQSNPDWKELDVTSIFVIDKTNTKSHRIYQNLEAKFLDSYDENSKKRLNAS